MRRTLVLAWAACLALAARSMAAEPEVYPAKGRTAAQQERDQYACHEWATKETGVDPVTLAEEKLATPAPAEDEGNAGGMARSAGLGAMGGAMEGDAGAGAMRGMGIGRMVSVIRAKRQLREHQSADAQEASALQAQLEKYDRAYAACLTGRGYAVK
jgi:hypothetical protein